MLHLLKRHPMPVVAHLRECLVLTYALPAETLAPLMPPGLVVDELRGNGFVAIAMVQTEGLRPVPAPAWLGQNFLLCGYRVFARTQTGNGERTMRGLRILRSLTDRRTMAFFGNLLTHYNYHTADVHMEHRGDELEVVARNEAGDLDLRVIADLSGVEADTPLPPGSPFRDDREARRFAGPLPYTFSYEPETHALVVVQGLRDDWHPRIVRAEVPCNRFFEQPAFAGVTPVLASAFHVADVPYRWQRGRRYPLAEVSA